MEPLLGQIQAFAFAWAPRGWMTCEGQLLPIAENTALFSLLGVQYGGDGRTNFGLPDLTKQSKSDGVSYCIAVVGVYPSRQ
jgi:microcystin-dependent protein